ncbi:tRNA (adenosine(37)-N6)-dimethylallyltransferase MiaA [Weissella ceti]|uniref:tRNA dimethylallyltransferase n=1 Tax=Weissella ceti TaxID=759620 RepID=A0ABT3E254_9LACO|nr:tRNA (adenosine(37)-N6)-dimethylallyltransferase MiaA [Weissella ceti]MCW0952500.1 tRNA (adenosine(37)-N6)-dimethylallyltransferase MiaA [Weissella ceti]QVK11831.1 tRNA (adenosine(37)-N6)-dimethylallyltransferase MiaA [Weissella ceti]
MQKLIVIVGPTAVGKTKLSLEIANAIDGEIISGDSMQIYRELSIGTAKATSEEQAQAPHHLIDVADPEEHYSAAKFVEMAQAAISDIASRGKTPILVGGTGFYVQALLGDRPLSVIEEQPDQAFEDYWDAHVQEYGEEGLRDALRAVDPISAERILPGQIRRLKRALLISQQMQQPFSSLQPEPKRQYDAYIIGLNTDRAKLYERINLRVDMMLAEGLMDEVALVHALSEDATARKAIGYKELFPYYEGHATLEQASEELKMASRRYAKRQLTWFNNQFTDIHWADLVQKPDTLNVILDDVHSFMS